MAAFVACVSPVDLEGGTFDPSVEERLLAELEALPEEPGAHADALVELTRQFPNHPAVLDAAERFNAEADARVGLLLAVEVQGHTIKFYEPEPGVLLVGEEAPENEPMLLPSGEGTSRSAAEVFSALLPNEEVPAVLAALDARRAPVGVPELADASGEDPDATVGGGESATPTFGSKDDEGVAYKYSADPYVFMRNGGCPTEVCNSTTRMSVCYPGWRNGIFAEGRAEHAEWHVASYSGDALRFRILRNGADMGVWYVGAGTRHMFNWNGPTRSREVCAFLNVIGCTTFTYVEEARLRAEVFDAAGDGFHFGGIWWTVLRGGECIGTISQG